MDNKVLWPGWETVRLIGRGSFGAVYEIERNMLGEKEKAALKVISIPENSGEIDSLRDEGYDDASITGTFKEHLKSIVAEYALMRKLNGNTNVVNCDDVRYVQHDDGFGWDIFIKMELLTPMKKALSKTPSNGQIARLGADICRALTLCKNYSIVHRDIKPDNIFVSDTGDCKLGDFGIARTMEKTSGGTKIGTYEYMAPEVYHGKPYGSGADIYSLGLVLYWLLNERRTPFLPLPPALPTVREKEEARLRRFSGEPIPAPAHGSEELQRIVLKACAYDPKDRYQSAAEMLRDLEALGAAPAAPVPAAPVPAPDASLSDEDESTAGVFRARKIDVRSAPVPAPDASLSDEDESTTGVFRARKIDAGPAPVPAAPAGADAPGGPSADEDATVTARENAAQKPKEAAEKASPQKKKFPLWIPIVGVLAAAAVLLIVLLPKQGKGEDSTPLFRTTYSKQTYADSSVYETYYYYYGNSGRKETYHDGELHRVEQLTLNEKGQIASAEQRKPDGTAGELTQYEYDEDGNVSHTLYYSEGVLYSEEWTEYSPGRGIEKQVRVLYDEDGRQQPYIYLEMTDRTHGVYKLELAGQTVTKTLERTYRGNYLESQNAYGEEGMLESTTTWEERDESYNWLRFSITDPTGWVYTCEQTLERIS